MNRMIYIVQSKDFEKNKDKACLLNLRLYDLVQSVYLWFQEIKTKMLEYELTQSKHDEILFFDQKRHLYVTVYVNDIKIFAFINEIIDEVSDFLKSKYEIIDLRNVKWYLRMKISQSEDFILLTQTKYIRDLLIRHEMKECAFVSISMTEKRLNKAPSRYKCLENQLKQFQILLDELMHLMIQTRLDLTYSVSRLAQFMSNSINDHWTTLKRMLRYLNETKEMNILYKKAFESLILKAWTDFSCNEDSNDSRSTHDHLLFMKRSVGWKSSKQISIALSSTEAEYMSQASAAINVMWARELLIEMRIDDTVPGKNQSTVIYADNQGAIKLANHSIFQKRTKHIAVKYHYTRNLISQKAIKLEYRLTAAMIADGLIKSLRPIQFKRFVDQLRMAKKRTTWRLNKLINKRQSFKESTWWVKTDQKEGH